MQLNQAQMLPSPRSILAQTQIELILTQIRFQDIEFQLERADWFQFFRGEMSMKLEKQYLHDNHIREKGLERFKSHITVPEAKINPVC